MLTDWLSLLEAFAWLGLLLVILPWLGGWRRLAKEYPGSVAVPTRGPWIFPPYLRLPFLLCWARVGAVSGGIYLEPSFPASLAFRPVFLPWTDITVATFPWGFGLAQLNLNRLPGLPVYLFGKYFRQLQSEAGRVS